MKSAKVASLAAALAVALGGGIVAAQPVAAAGSCHSFWTELKHQHVKPSTKCKDVNLTEVKAKRVSKSVYFGEYKSGDSWKTASARLELKNGKVGTKVIIGGLKPGTIYRIRATNGATVKVLH